VGGRIHFILGCYHEGPPSTIELRTDFHDNGCLEKWLKNSQLIIMYFSIA